MSSKEEYTDENGQMAKGNNDSAHTLTNVEGASKRLPYPKRVFFIISNELCERFNFYGMKAILVLYMTKKLKFDNDTSTIIYHAFTMLVYFMCIFGAIISDTWLGKFKTIFSLSLVYAAGSILTSVGAIPTINISHEVSLFVGLLLIALGSGGIKPCVSAFGGDQFKLPEQTSQMASFFSLFYFTINVGSLLSMFLTPVLREDVYCFNETDCYPLAFGVPAILMVTSIFLFLVGKPFYNIVPPAGNMLVRVTKCITTAISTKKREKNTNPRKHWLDYAEGKYGRQLVSEVKILLKVLVLFLPLPIFWTLFDQQGSRWTFQATRMDGDIGFYVIKPDQMQIVNPLFIMVFIPLFDIVLYPLLSKIGVRRPLQKFTIGGLLAGVAFIISALVEFQLEKSNPILPHAGEAQLRVFSGLPCTYSAVTNIPNLEKFTIQSMQSFEEKYININGQKSFKFTFSTTVNSNDCPKTLEAPVELNEKRATSVFLSKTPEVYRDKAGRSDTGDPIVRFLVNAKQVRKLNVRNAENQNAELIKSNTTDRRSKEAYAGSYDVLIDDKKILTINLPQGSSRTFVLREKDDGSFADAMFEIAERNSMSILWLIPQYIVITAGEIMFSITGLSFSYAEAPESMKSVLTACWLLTVAFGNAILMIVVEIRVFESQAYEFLLFAGLMFVDMLVFIILAYNYKSVKAETEERNIIENDARNLSTENDVHSAATLSTAPVEDNDTNIQKTSI